MDSLDKPVDRGTALNSSIFMLDSILKEMTNHYHLERQDNLMQRTLALAAVKKILIDLKEGTL
jgi:hypothetical protein